MVRSLLLGLLVLAVSTSRLTAQDHIRLDKPLTATVNYAQACKLVEGGKLVLVCLNRPAFHLDGYITCTAERVHGLTDGYHVCWKNAAGVEVCQPFDTAPTLAQADAVTGRVRPPLPKAVASSVVWPGSPTATSGPVVTTWVTDVPDATVWTTDAVTGKTTCSGPGCSAARSAGTQRRGLFARWRN